MRNLNTPPQTYYGTLESDPWGAPSYSPDDWSTSIDAYGNFDGGFGGSAVTDPLEAAYAAPAFEAGNERRETLRSKVVRKMGAIAARASGIFLRDKGAGDVFGAGGAVSQGIDRAHSVVDRAANITDTKTIKVAKRVPVIGKYVKTAEKVVGAAKAVSEASRQYSYDQFATGVSTTIENRDQFVADAQGAGKRVAIDALRAGASAAGERFGVTIDNSGEYEVKRRKVGRGIAETILNPSLLLGDVRKGLDAAAVAVQTGASNEFNGLRDTALQNFAPGPSNTADLSRW